MWVCPLGFAPEVALEGLDLPLTGASVEVVQLLGSQGFWQHQLLREIGILGSWKHGALKAYGSQYWQISSHIFAWRPNLPNREAWQAIVYRLSKSWTLKRPCMHRLKTFFFFFFACGSSVPVKVEREGGADAWLVGTLEAPSVEGHRLPPLQESWPYQSLFSSFL